VLQTVGLLRLSYRPSIGQCLRLATTQGAIVANYPWDGNVDMATRYEASPDDTAFKHLASVYAGSHASMAASAEFKGGITNGAAWYPVQNGMQVGCRGSSWVKPVQPGGIKYCCGPGPPPERHAATV
jgi:hypothetical protein